MIFSPSWSGWQGPAPSLHEEREAHLLSTALVTVTLQVRGECMAACDADSYPPSSCVCCRCNRHRPAPSLYEECKAACDAYFYLPARREHRGIGGIFFDDLAAGASGGVDPETVWTVSARPRVIISSIAGCKHGGTR